jgi:hypothetical protein
MKVFCLTEHMPRHKEDFYPEEVRHSDRKSKCITQGPKSKS